MIIKNTKSEKETIAFAKEFSSTLKPRDVIVFTGGLGVGKTAFCKGIALGLNCIDEVSSPTFAIVNAYRGEQVFAHFDMYRISTLEDLNTCGFYDYIDQDAILAVEWSENIKHLLDFPCISVNIEYVGEEERKITIG